MGWTLSVSWDPGFGANFGVYSGEYVKAMMVWRLQLTWMRMPQGELIEAWNEKWRDQ